MMKKIVIIVLFASSYLWGSTQNNSPEFNKVMDAFAQNFQKFAHVYTHGSKEEQKQIYKLAAKALESCVNLYTHVKTHPDEKRFVPLEHRKALENTLHQLPQPTKKQFDAVQCLRWYIDQTALFDRIQINRLA